MTRQRLEWHPKPFTAGDMDGAGSEELLGRPRMGTLSVLVRETAQNSWDARRHDRRPVYEVRLRTLTPSQQSVLLDDVLTAGAPDFDFGRLRQKPLKVIEISDRGTTGLGGPLRNDHTVSAASTDFADFVLSVGAPRNTKAGGGTYGFGKTAAYRASSLGTIVIWSRALDAENGQEHRFIASCIGRSFEMDGIRYTGRQWWGARPVGDLAGFMTAPALGSQAEDLGEALFDRGFDEGETGTSLLILAPDLEEFESEPGGGFGDLTAWRRAIVLNLWPKILPGQPESRTMDIRLFHEGCEIPLELERSGLLRAYRTCLEAVRAHQAGRPVEGAEIHATKRYSQETGHLAVTNAVVRDDDPYASGVEDRIALMRHDAELLVKYRSVVSTADQDVCWVAVFKPVEEMDDHFAKAEPPAHDTWEFESLEGIPKSVVKLALRNMADSVKAFVKPEIPEPQGEGHQSTAKLAASMATLAEAHDQGADDHKRRKRRSVGVPKAKCTVMSSRPEPRTASERALGRQHSTLLVEVTGPGEKARVHASRLAVAVDGGSAADDDVRLDGWYTSNGEWIEGEESMVVAEGDHVTAQISYPVGMAVDVHFSAEGVDE